jgi:hypothetical protein
LNLLWASTFWSAPNLALAKQALRNSSPFWFPFVRNFGTKRELTFQTFGANFPCWIAHSRWCAGRSHIHTHTHTRTHTHTHHHHTRHSARFVGHVGPQLSATPHFTWRLFGHHPKKISVWENDATDCGVFKLIEMHHSTRAHFAQFEHALQSGRLRHVPKNRD